MLRFFRACHHDAGGHVGNANRGIRCVDVLTTCARRPHRVYTQVSGINLDVHVFGLRQDRDRRGRGVDATAAFSTWNTLHPVYATFKLQPCKDVLSLDVNHRFLDPSKFRLLQLDHIDFPAFGFGIALIHPQQVPCKKRSFIASGTRADFQHCRFCVGFIFWQKRKLQRGFGVWQRSFQPRQFLFGQWCHIRIVQHLARFVQIAQQLLIGLNLLHHRAQVRVFF